MRWAVGIGIGVALGLTVLGSGVRLVVRGRRDSQAAGAEDRMVASLRVAAGVRLLTQGVLVLVLVGIAAFTWR